MLNATNPAEARLEAWPKGRIVTLVGQLSASNMERIKSSRSALHFAI
jgi:hypothetical protein